MIDHRHDPEFAALLAAVRAAPKDDAPRLIAADWLMERGDPWGDFIAWQLKNKGVRQGGRTSPGGYRYGNDDLFVFDNVREWMPAVASSWEWTWERGFPHRIRLPAEELGSVLPLLLNEWPIREVVIVGEDSWRGWREGMLNQFRRLGVAFFTEPSSVWRGGRMTTNEFARVRAAVKELERIKDKAAADRYNWQTRMKEALA